MRLEVAKSIVDFSVEVGQLEVCENFMIGLHAVKIFGNSINPLILAISNYSFTIGTHIWQDSNGTPLWTEMDWDLLQDTVRNLKFKEGTNCIYAY